MSLKIDVEPRHGSFQQVMSLDLWSTTVLRLAPATQYVDEEVTFPCTARINTTTYEIVGGPL